METDKSLPTRPKVWNELTDIEKIERCRDEIKNTQRKFNRELSRAQNTIKLLLEHRHLSTGELVKIIDRYNYSSDDTCGEISCNSAEIYF